MSHYTIGQLAKRIGTTIVTIRYYEKKGLLGSVKRSAGGFRLYHEDAVSRFNFIKNAQSVGFKLEEVNQLLALQQKKATSMAVKKKTQNKIGDIDKKITMLKQMRTVLAKWEQACDGLLPIDKCPILANLYTYHKQQDK